MSLYTEYKQKQNILKRVVQACQFLLQSSDHAIEARAYLNKRLSKKDQIAWKFGYFPSDDHLKDLTDLVSKKDLQVFNLYHPKDNALVHGHFAEHNLVMPFNDVHGDIVALVGRCLITEEERHENGIYKYKYSAGCQKDLFVYGLDKALDSIIKNKFVVCVEGQFDCISLHSRGIHNAVALGSASMSKYQFFQIRRYTDNIVLMLDSDEAGKKGKKRIRTKYKDDAIVKTVSVPDGFKDIDEFFRDSKDKVLVKSVIDTIRIFGETDGKKV